MRTFLITCALLLSACQPPDAPPDAVANAGDVGEPTPLNPDAAALSADPSLGQWFALGDGATIAAGFGLPESEFQLMIICNSATGDATVRVERELSPDQDTTLRIITEARTVDLPARSFNEGLPSVSAELDNAAAERQALIDTLTPVQQRLGVEISGEVNVFPWDQSIAQALEACG